MSTSKALLGAALVMSASLAVGCGNRGTEVPVTVPPDGGYQYDAGFAPPPPPPPTPDAGPPTPPAPQSGPCDPVQTTAMATLFMARQKADAPGMQPEGGPVCGVVPDQQSVSSPTFVLQPGHCYTVLAQALPNVSQVDVQLELDLSAGMNPALAAFAGKPLLAVGDSAGVTATLGAKNNCYQWALPIGAPVKVTVKSKMGAGIIAAQLYSKKK
jgi:hypothetical protein